MNTNQAESPQLPNQVIFFVLDPSAGCNCMRINAINHAMSKVASQLREVQNTYRDWVHLKVAVLEAGASAKWYSKTPVSVDDFEWQDLKAGVGPMNWEHALLELESQLGRNAMLHSTTGSNVPIIIFIANSHPANDWMHGKNCLHRNNWFKCAIKQAITEDSVCADILTEIITIHEACHKLDEISRLSNVLPKVLQLATTFITIGRPYYKNRPPQFREKMTSTETNDINPSHISEVAWDDEGW